MQVGSKYMKNKILFHLDKSQKKARNNSISLDDII